MPRLSRTQQQAMASLRAIASQPLPPDPLGRALVESLERAIGWDGYRLFGVDSQTLLINRLLAASENDGWARLEWLQEVYLADQTPTYLQLPEILRAGLKGVAYQPRQEESWGYPAWMLQTVDPEHHWRYFYESMSPIGGTLHAGFESAGRKVAVLQAYRREHGSEFRPRDVAMVRSAAPLIGRALAASLAREQARSSAHSPAEAGEASGIVILSADGTIALATPAGESWLERLRHGERIEPGTLPTAVWSAVKGFQGASLPAIRIAAMTVDGPVTLEASAAGGQESTAIVIAPHQQPTPVPPGEWGLTPQQNQIVMHVLAGSSNREIAQQLFVSEHTVEWHLRQIYRALDLSSRTQLQARYFRDVGLGSYREPDPGT